MNVLRGAIPELLSLAKDESEFTRLAALEIFGLLGPSTEEVKQAVIAGLADTSDWVKQSACLAIKAWGPAGAPAVGMLIPLLRSAVDEYACDALRAIGPAAAPALSVLRERARRADPSGRDHAKQAIAAITAGQPAKPAKATPLPPSAGGLAIGEKVSIPLGGARPDVFALSPDGRSIALSADDWVSLRRLEDWERLFLYRLGAKVTQVAFSPDGKLIAVAGWEGNLRVLRAEAGEVLLSASGANFTERPMFSPDGRLLAFVTDPPGISVWDRESGEARLISVAGPPLALVFDSNGGEGTPILVWSGRGAKRFEAASGKEISTHVAMGWRRSSALFQGASGRFILVSCGKKKADVLVEDAVTGEFLFGLSGSFELVKRYIQSPDRATLGVVSGKAITFFRLDNGQLVGEVKLRGQTIRHAAFSPDGRSVLALDYSGALTSWPLG